MNKLLIISILLSVVMLTGCANHNYRVYVYNGTPTKVTETKVTLANGECLTYGTLYPSIDKGVWPVPGPLGEESLVEWKTFEDRKAVKTPISCGFHDNSVIFIINTNDTVSVETGRGLYGYKKRK